MKYKIDRTNGESTQFEIVANDACIEGTWTSSNVDIDAVANDIWITLRNEYGVDCRIIVGDFAGNIINGQRSITGGRYVAEIRRNPGV